MDSKTLSAKWNGDYQKVCSSGYRKSSSLTHYRYESDQKDNPSPHISSVSSVQSAGYSVVSSSHENSSLLSHSREESNKNDISPPHIPSVPSTDNRSSDQVHVPAFPESSAHPRDRKVHVPPVHCKDEKIFGTSSGKKDSYFPNKSLYAESFVSEQENFHTGAQPSMPQGGIYLPSGWYINVGAAYCGGCQLHGTLLQRLD